jgi:hypothetical protein
VGHYLVQYLGEGAVHLQTNSQRQGQLLTYSSPLSTCRLFPSPSLQEDEESQGKGSNLKLWLTSLDPFSITFKGLTVHPVGSLPYSHPYSHTAKNKRFMSWRCVARGVRWKVFSSSPWRLHLPPAYRNRERGVLVFP